LPKRGNGCSISSGEKSDGSIPSWMFV
jgi:hypothetical protein